VRADYHDTIASYKSELDALHKEVAVLRKAAAAKPADHSRSFASSADSSGAGPADAARVAELEAEVAKLEAENLVLATQTEGAKGEAAAAVERVAEEKDVRWKAKVAEAVKKEREASAKEIQQLRRERECSIGGGERSDDGADIFAPRSGG
jgi:hypothetical protein